MLSTQPVEPVGPVGAVGGVLVLMVKLVLVAEVRLALLADRVYVPAVPTVRLLKVATPFCGVAVSVPPEGQVPPYKGKCDRIGGGGDGISVAILDRYS